VTTGGLRSSDPSSQVGDTECHKWFTSPPYVPTLTFLDIERNIRDPDHNAIEIGSQKIAISGFNTSKKKIPFTPKIGDFVCLYESKWTIMEVITHRSGSLVAAYELVIRQMEAG